MERIIQPVAQNVGQPLTGQRTNAALDLAASLRQVTPELQRTVEGIAQRRLVRADQQARQAVLENGGEPMFADAVRNGDIRPTQNPFFIDAYNRERAQVLGRRRLSQLQLDAINWPERSDPAAFQERFTREAGQIASEFEGVAAQNGIQPVIAEVSQQVIASNLSQNASRIEQERENNSVELVARFAQDLHGSSAGFSPQAFFEGSRQLEQDFLSTGGTPEQFDRILEQGLTAAAFQTRDETLLDQTFTFDRGDNRGRLGDDPQRADTAAGNRFNIIRANESAQTREATQRNNRLREDTELAVDLIFENFPQVIEGEEIPEDELVALLQENNLNPRIARRAVGTVAQELQRGSSLFTAGTDDGIRLLGLSRTARQRGFSPALAEELEQAIIDDVITPSDAERIQGQAFARTRQLEADARRDATDSDVEGSGLVGDFDTIPQAYAEVDRLADLAHTADQIAKRALAADDPARRLLSRSGTDGRNALRQEFRGIFSQARRSGEFTTIQGAFQSALVTFNARIDGTRTTVDNSEQAAIQAQAEASALNAIEDELARIDAELGGQ